MGWFSGRDDLDELKVANKLLDEYRERIERLNIELDEFRAFYAGPTADRQFRYKGFLDQYINTFLQTAGEDAAIDMDGISLSESAIAFADKMYEAVYGSPYRLPAAVIPCGKPDCVACDVRFNGDDFTESLAQLDADARIKAENAGIS